MREHMAYYLVPWGRGTIHAHSRQLSTKLNEKCQFHSTFNEGGVKFQK